MPATCGLSVKPVCAGAPLAAGMYTPLSEAVEAWHFDLAAPREDSDRKCALCSGLRPAFVASARLPSLNRLKALRTTAHARLKARRIVQPCMMRAIQI